MDYGKKMRFNRTGLSLLRGELVRAGLQPGGRLEQLDLLRVFQLKIISQLSIALSEFLQNLCTR